MVSVDLDALNRARDRFLELLCRAHASHGRAMLYRAECRIFDGVLVIDKENATVYESRAVLEMISNTTSAK